MMKEITKYTVILSTIGLMVTSGIAQGAKIYNETFNPRQKEYANHLGFNDLHIEAIRHLRPEGKSKSELAKLDVVVHHHCKAYDDGTLACPDVSHRQQGSG